MCHRKRLIIDIFLFLEQSFVDPDQGQCDGVRERHHVVQGEGCYQCLINMNFREVQEHYEVFIY